MSWPGQAEDEATRVVGISLTLSRLVAKFGNLRVGGVIHYYCWWWHEE
jgi:hypothetical protein